MSITAIAAPPPTEILLDCSTNKIVITSRPTGEATSQSKEKLLFRINDAAKSVMLNNTPLVINRFDPTWITAEHDEIIYDLDREKHTLSYAGSRAQDATVTTIIGSGLCKLTPTPKR
jgi:hypothetical protein